MSDNNEQQGSETPTQVFNKYQAMTGGVISGVGKYLPHTLALLAASVGAASFVENRLGTSKEQQDTQAIWQHSGDWHKEWKRQDDGLMGVSNELQTEIQDLQAQLNQLQQEQKEKGH